MDIKCVTGQLADTRGAASVIDYGGFSGGKEQLVRLLTSLGIVAKKGLNIKPCAFRQFGEFRPFRESAQCQINQEILRPNRSNTLPIALVGGTFQNKKRPLQITDFSCERVGGGTFRQLRKSSALRYKCGKLVELWFESLDQQFRSVSVNY